MREKPLSAASDLLINSIIDQYGEQASFLWSNGACSSTPQMPSSTRLVDTTIV
jgi:hypothetical protein